MVYNVDPYLPGSFDVPLSILEGVGDIVDIRVSGRVDLCPLLKNLETIQEGQSI